jgi:hypothetical protein
MKRRIGSSSFCEGQRTRAKLVLSAVPVLLLSLLALTQANCTLSHATLQPRFDQYVCRATLIDPSNGESRVVRSSMLHQTAPGAALREFYNYDWDGNRVRNHADVLLDWRRYLANNVLNIPTFTGRSWCASPVDVSCEQTGKRVINNMTAPMPGGVLLDCAIPPGPLQYFEITAPGLAPANLFSFPDTPLGDSSAPVTFTVTNRGTVPLRVVGIDFLAGANPDFVKSGDTCLPTTTERLQGRGHLLGEGLTCSFQLQFRPQHRDGVAECDGSAPNESCRRRERLFVTGEVDTGRSALFPVFVWPSGRAIGGGIVTEPSEVCFPTAPPIGSCTAPQMFRILNSSTGPLTITSARLTRAGNRFEAPMPFLMSYTFSRPDTIEIPVRFCNVADDRTDGEYTINSSAINPTTVVRLVNPLNRTCP